MVLTWVCSSVLLDFCGSTFCFAKACRSLMAFTTFCGHTGLFHEGHNVRRAGHSTILCHWAPCSALMASLGGAQFQIIWGDWHFRGFVICIFKAQWDKIRWLGGTCDFVWSLWLCMAVPAFLRLPLFLLSGTVGSTNCVDWKANGSMSKEAMPINSASAAGWGGDIRAGTQEEEETVSFLWSLRLERESPVNLLSSSSSLKEIDKPSLVESGRRGRYIFDPPETKHQRSAYRWVTTVKQLAFKLY